MQFIIWHHIAERLCIVGNANWNEVKKNASIYLGIIDRMLDQIKTLVITSNKHS